MDDVAVWIAELRGRVVRGELAGLGRVVLDGGSVMLAEPAARILLADLDHCGELTRERPGDLRLQARREAVLRDLVRLRQQVG